MKRKWWTRSRREALDCYIFMSPVIIGLIVFMIGPMIASLYFSFTKYDILGAPKWIGLANYNGLFHDHLFWQSLKVSCIYAVTSVPLNLIFGLFLAILLNRKIKGIFVFRTIYYLPAVISGVAVSLLWMRIFNPNFGLLNWFLGLFGINGPQWLYSEHWALPAIILMSLWGVGGGMLINLAGLQSIPNDLYEASEIDGANKIKQFFHITIPMLSPIIFFNLVMGMISALQIFTEGYVMTGGGPNNSTLFSVLYLYRNAFKYLDMGYASALAWVLFIIIMLLTLLVFKSSPMWVYYEGERKN